MRIFKFAGVLALSGLLLGAAGCGIPESEKTSGTLTRTVTDDVGNRVTVPVHPERIVSLDLATDEIILDLVDSSRVSGVSFWSVSEGISTVAEKAQKVPNQIRYYDAEEVLVCRPDIVIAPDWTSADLLRTLKDLGVTVYISRSSLSVENVKVSLAEIADALNEKEKGKKIAADMERDLDKAAARKAKIPESERKNVVLYSHLRGYIGKGSLFDDLCQYAGVINGAALIGMGANDPLAEEGLVLMNPDIILIPTWSYGNISPERIKEELLTDPAMQPIKAVQNRAFRQVPDKYLYSASPAMTKAILGIQDAAYGGN